MSTGVAMPRRRSSSMSERPSRLGSIRSTIATSYGCSTAALQPGLAVRRMIDGEAGLAQSADDEVRDRGIVFDEQRPHISNHSEVRLKPDRGCVVL